LAYTPITAIEILSSSLVAGYGCGPADNQVYKYLAVVWQPGDPARAVCNVFDCFTPQGVFENLLPDGGLQPDGSPQEFTLKIFAFNRAAYLQQQGTLQGPAIDGGLCPALADGGGAPGAQWTTTCTATPVQGIPVLAVCPPLEPTAQGADAAVDGQEAGPEAGQDAGQDIAQGAGQDAGPDAGGG
jgi:hypothetical protein